MTTEEPTTRPPPTPPPKQFDHMSEAALDGYLLDAIAKLSTSKCRVFSATKKTNESDTAATKMTLSNNSMQQLYLHPISFRSRAERYMYVQLPPGVWLDHERRRSVLELLVRVGAPRKATQEMCAVTVSGDLDQTSMMCCESEDDTHDAHVAHVAIAMDDGTTRYFIVEDMGEEASGEEVEDMDKEDEDAEGNIGRLENMLGEALSTLDDEDETVVEVYVPPSDTALEKRDKFWSKNYVMLTGKKGSRAGREQNGGGGTKETKTSSAYRHYRDDIDDLLLRAVSRYCGDKDSWRVAELCSGDGSFASKLLGEHGTKVQRYVLFERNKKLARASRERLKKWDEERRDADEEERNVEGRRIQHVTVDVCGEDGDVMISQQLAACDAPPNIWIASGSVLNGQVGSHATAESVLLRMVDSMSGDGRVVITGYTQTWLTPQILRRCGLRVLRGSIPCNESNGLESGFGRFHMFVLEREWVSDPEKEDRLLRSVMLGDAVRR